MKQYFAWTDGNKTDAAYVRFDSSDAFSLPVVVTHMGKERAPNHPLFLSLMPGLVIAGKARLISKREAERLVTQPTGLN